MAITLVSGLHPPRLVDAIVEHLTGWLVQHTYSVVFLAALIDATAIPFPGRVVVAAAGAVAAAGDANLLVIIALGTLGLMITDHAWYLARPLRSDRLVRLYCRLTFSSPDCVGRTTDWFRRFGALTILAGRFVAVVRVLAWPLARDHGVRYPTFLALDAIAALVWTAQWAGFGWLLGAHWSEASAEVRWITAALAVAGVLVFMTVRLWRRTRQRAAASAAR
jgi:membrane protein DedA with SNARE-associated domain